MKEDVEALTKRIESLEKIKKKKPKFPCFMNEMRPCKWTCPAHSEYASLRLAHGYKAAKTKIFAIGYCTIVKAAKEGNNTAKEIIELMKESKGCKND